MVVEVIVRVQDRVAKIVKGRAVVLVGSAARNQFSLGTGATSKFRFSAFSRDLELLDRVCVVGRQ